MNNVPLGEARGKNCLLFECVAGSRAYGTDTPQSDTDLRGVFVMPRESFFEGNRIEQVSDEKNDETYYEVGRFVELLGKNNPNLLEILYAEEDAVRFRHNLFDLIRPEWILSKLCESTFAGYAMTQVQKARGLNKKIVNPMEGPRRSVLSFCHVVQGQGSVPLEDWLRGLRKDSRHCGLVKIPHMRDVYGIYHDPSESLGYRGIIRTEDSTELNLSSVPKEEEPIGWMNFNKDGFKKYCKEYREYQDWLKNRNESRYADNVAHGRNYDSKNLMHTFRLLGMAEEIAREGLVRVRRPDREFLLQIRQGHFDYEELMAMAEDRIERIKEAFAESALPAAPNVEALTGALVEIREEWYRSC
ncbi:MAG: nucleotidyltransferase domain-containing protein [Verrucomicrobiota bacterium]